MLVPSIITFAIASVAVCLSVNTTEEIVKVAATFIAGLCLFFSLFFAPVFIKLLVMAVPFFSRKLQIADTSE